MKLSARTLAAIEQGPQEVFCSFEKRKRTEIPREFATRIAQMAAEDAQKALVNELLGGGDRG